MQNSNAPTQQAPTPANPSAASLAALKAALTASTKVQLVTPEENAKKIKTMAQEAKALLKELRSEGDLEPANEPDASVVEEQSFGMGPRAFVANANISPDEQRQIDLATEQFKQSVERVDNQILARYVQAVQNGDYAEAEAILENAVESQQTHTLMFALLTIGAILLPLYAKQRLQHLLVQFGLHTVFAQTKSGQAAMKLQAERGAKSHVHTIAKDLKNSLDDAIDSELSNPSIEAALKDKFEALASLDEKQYLRAVHKDENIYAYARDLILKGDTRQAVIKNLQENFAGIGKRRATVIAGNEANRVFTMSQFDADKQFLAQNQLTDKAYKRLVSNTGHPEAICQAIIDATALNPIPFKNDFIPFGKTFSVKDGGKTYKIKPTYEKLQSGHIHVNCQCRYELLIQREDGSFFNTYDGKMLNDVPFVEDLHPRDLTGKFAKKKGGSKSIPVDLSKLGNVNDFNKYVESSYFDGSLGQHSGDVTDSVRAYQGHMYDAINIHARANMLDDPLNVYGTKTTYGDTIKNIDTAANVTLANDTTIYRGTEIPVHQNTDVGETIHSRSFLSTSTDQKIADTFKYKGGSMLVISAKKGQKAIIPDYVTFGKRGRTMGEAEVLMPSGSSLTITRIDGDIVYADLH